MSQQIPIILSRQATDWSGEVEFWAGHSPKDGGPTEDWHFVQAHDYLLDYENIEAWGPEDGPKQKSTCTCQGDREIRTVLTIDLQQMNVYAVIVQHCELHSGGLMTCEEKQIPWGRRMNAVRFAFYEVHQLVDFLNKRMAAVDLTERFKVGQVQWDYTA